MRPSDVDGGSSRSVCTRFRCGLHDDSKGGLEAFTSPTANVHNQVAKGVCWHRRDCSIFESLHSEFTAHETQEWQSSTVAPAGTGTEADGPPALSAARSQAAACGWRRSHSILCSRTPMVVTSGSDPTALCNPIYEC